jgi:type VI secretion system protein ImpG
MDPRLLKFYNQELQYVREMGGEFAAAYPKIAGRLGLDGFECADPYVERLLEGFGFLAARVQLKLDAEFSNFTQHLLEMVYPHYLSPTPSMMVAQFQPDLTQGQLADGYTIPRGTTLRSRLGKTEQTSCEYRTGHPVTLWPLRLARAEYISRDVASMQLPTELRRGEAFLRLRFQTTAGLKVSQLALQSLPLFLRGRGERPMRLYEQCLARVQGILVRPGEERPAWQDVLPAKNIQAMGFEDDQSLLPFGPASFNGYRLLHEYFAFPQRFLFLNFTGLESAIRRCQAPEFEIVVVFDRADQQLDNVVSPQDFALFCSPAINLFPRRADSIVIDHRQSEHHVVPDRTRPLDLEVFRVTRVVGTGVEQSEEQEFLPFYSHTEHAGMSNQTFFTTRRLPRTPSSRQLRQGPRSSYMGSEVYLSLVDARSAPYRHTLRLLTLDTLCTNRDLPLHMPLGAGGTDFTLEIGAPVDEVRCIAGPSTPRPSFAHASGELLWRLVSHLSLNYLSLADSASGERSASALRELLELYADAGEAETLKQLMGLAAVESHPIIRRLPTDGPTTIGRGLQVAVTLNEDAFEGSGVFLLGAVLERFFAKYVSINSFTEMVLRTNQRGEIKRWPMRIGRRHLL